MSRTTVYKIRSDGQVEPVAEIHNAWNFGPAIWSTLAEKYLPGKHWMMNSDEVWALQDDDRLEATEKLALLATFDRVWIPREKLFEVVGAVAELAWRPLEAMRAARAALAADREARGICFQGTSVSADMWRDEEGQLLNIDRNPLCSDGKPHWRIDEPAKAGP